MKMPKFRKKPVEIEANQWSEADPLVLSGVHKEEGIVVDAYYVTTIHSQKAYLADGDWILPEPKPGHFYPCKPDIFAATYDPIE
jgi:hypothetical protein